TVTLRLVQEGYALFLFGLLGTTQVKFLIDSGATASLVSPWLVQEAGLFNYLDFRQSFIMCNSVHHQYTPQIRGRLHAPLVCTGVDGRDLVLRPYFLVMDAAMPVLGLDMLCAHGACLFFAPNPHVVISVDPMDAHIEPPLKVMCRMGCSQEIATVDTGATTTFISFQAACRAGLRVTTGSHWSS
ncbi:unnamed protein product, partial [Meganyctiphanes norvegica]